MATNPTLVMDELKDFWKKGWEAAKEKMVKKVSNPEVQTLWHTNARSEGAEKSYAEETGVAIKERRRKAGIEKKKPVDWGTGAAEGIGAKVLTATEQENWAREGGPYVVLVHEVRTLYRQAGLSGIAGGKWWMDNVAARLKLAKSKPEMIPTIRREIIAALAAKARELGITLPAIA